MEQPNIFAYIPDNQYDYKKVFSGKDKPIRLFQAFSGIGCQAMAFNRLGIPYVNVGTSEIDKYAIMSYEAIHGDSNNYGDISKMKEIPICDIFTWSFPCIDLSKAGKQKGLQGGTRSGLVYEVLRLLHATETKPKVLIMENVVDLVQVKFAAEFYEIQNEIASFGYKNYTQVLNAKHYGVAQNRERVFMVSILGNEHYEFPPRIRLEKRLKDYLEDEVDEKYYLSNKLIKCFEEHKERNDTSGGGNMEPKILEETICLNSKVNGKQPSLQDRIYSSEGVATAITDAFRPNIKEPNGFYKQAIETAQNNDIEYGDSINAFNQQVDKSGCSPTITTRPEGKKTAILPITHDLRIRKLTPKECWRLMGIDDADFDKAQKVVSNSQLYKQAGNGIVVDVFAAILKGLIFMEGEKNESK